jgi:hypothetical protein
VDYHPSVQQIAFANADTGECGERRLNHSDGEAERFYRELKAAGCRVRVGMEATGHARWFERLLAELGSLSSGVGTQCGKSRSASAAVASASAGADADADHESVACRGHE